MARPLRVAWHDSEAQLGAAYRAEHDGRVRQRLQAVWLLRQGWSIGAVAAVVGASYRSIETWLRWYEAGGTAELARHRVGGQPGIRAHYLTEEQQQALVTKAVTTGFATQATAGVWLREQFAVTLSARQLRRLFTRFPFRAKVPRPISDRADPDAQEVFKKGGLPSR